MQPFDHKIIILRKPPSEAVLVGLPQSRPRGRPVAHGSGHSARAYQSLGGEGGTRGDSPGGCRNRPHLEKDFHTQWLISEVGESALC